jgi:hypothetical protein
MAFHRNAPIPDDPTNLSKDQMDAMLSMAHARCVTPGTRVRIHSRSQRLNGLTGVVKSATESFAWVALEGPDMGDEYRFSAEEMEPLRESQEQDTDAPGPYMVALDYITPLKELGYELISGLGSDHLHGTYRKHLNRSNGCQFKGDLRILVEPVGAAAAIEISYRAEGDSVRIQDIMIPAIDAIDCVREIEAMTHKAAGITQFAELVKQRNWPGTAVTPPGHMTYWFGEALDPDAPEHYVNELQAHARIIGAFRSSDYSSRIARRPQGSRKYYEMFVVRHPASDASYELFLEPLQDGSWSILARGYKYFDHPRHGEIQEMFDIPQTWEIPAGISDADLQPLVDHILAEIHKHQGPEDLSDETLNELDHLGESVDDINFDAYAKDSAGYNLVQLLTPKEVRAMIRAAGYKVNTLYRSRRTTGWSATATPATDEVFQLFRANYTQEEHRAWTAIWTKFKERFPSFNESQLLERVYFHIWAWSGATSADPNNPNNYTLFVEIQPPDYQQRRQGVVKEAADPDDPEAFINNTRRAKMGELVTVKCPGCGDVRQLLKNWPDGLDTDFTVLRLGTKCEKCDTFIPYTNLLVGEAVEEPDPDMALDPAQYAKTTFEPRQFLEAAGWVLQTERADYEYWRKEFPLPRHYVLGGMTFDQLVAQVGYYTRNTRSMGVDVNIFFNNLEQKFGLPVKGWRLEPQLLGYPIDGEESYDAAMTLRRFAMGIGQVLANVPWPPGGGALAASSAVERTMAAFAHEVNDRAETPLHPEQVNEAHDPDAPDNYVSSLGTLQHVAARFGLRKSDPGKLPGLSGSKWERKVSLNHPMEVFLAGPRQWMLPAFRVILTWNPTTKTAAIILRGVSDQNRDLLIWHSTAAYSSEAAAAIHLNEALAYLFQSIDDTHEPHQYQRLKEILQMGVGPFMLKVEGEDEDPI